MYELYTEHILNHGMNPRHWGILRPADAEFMTDNARCGDSLHLTLRLDNQQRIIAVGWAGETCTISQAAASMLGERIIGKTVAEVETIGINDIFTMLGITVPNNRIPCALLPLKVLTTALYGPDVWYELEMDAL